MENSAYPMLITPDLLGSGKDLFFEDDRNELALGVVLLFVSRHPLSPAPRWDLVLHKLNGAIIRHFGLFLQLQRQESAVGAPFAPIGWTHLLAAEQVATDHS
jgi:hypothetical protein